MSLNVFNKKTSSFTQNYGRPGVVYILESDGLRSGWLKIGCSTRSGGDRAKDLNDHPATDTPGKFRCIFQCQTLDCGKAEQLVFKHLAYARKGKKGQEYFEVGLEYAKETIVRICISINDELDPVKMGRSGIVYILENDGIRTGWWKIGGSIEPGRAQADKLNRNASTGTPGAFKCVFQYPTLDCGKAEQLIFERLAQEMREKDYFEVGLEHAKETIVRICKSINDELAAPLPSEYLPHQIVNGYKPSTSSYADVPLCWATYCVATSPDIYAIELICQTVVLEDCAYAWVDGVDMQNPILVPVDELQSYRRIGTFGSYLRDERHQDLGEMFDALLTDCVSEALNPTLIVRACESMHSDGFRPHEAIAVAREWGETIHQINGLNRAQNRHLYQATVSYQGDGGASFGV